MIRAQVGNDFFFGITENDVLVLKGGDIISVKLRQSGDMLIIICYGETDEKLVLELQEIAGSQIKITSNKRGAKKKTHCVRGHEKTPENTYSYLSVDGYVVRCCRECHRIAVRERRKNAKLSRTRRITK